MSLDKSLDMSSDLRPIVKAPLRTRTYTEPGSVKIWKTRHEISVDKRIFLHRVQALFAGEGVRFLLLLLLLFVVTLIHVGLSVCMMLTESSRPPPPPQLTFCAINLNVSVAFHFQSFVSCVCVCVCDQHGLYVI